MYSPSAFGGHPLSHNCAKLSSYHFHMSFMDGCSLIILHISKKTMKARQSSVAKQTLAFLMSDSESN